MGSSSQSTQTQSSTQPWAAAMPTVNNLFNSVNGLLPNIGATGAEQGAINQLTASGQAGNPYAGSIGNVATGLLNGGGAQNNDGLINNAYQQYYAQTNPLASNTNYDPMSTPGLGTQLQALQDSITGSVNGQFAAAGRDMSAMNSKALGTGLTNGLAPIITNQYNQNVANQQGAAGNLFNAGNTRASLLNGTQAQSNANRVQGVQTSNDALNAQNWGPQQVLTAQELAKSIPASNLGLLANIGIPLASLGQNSTGTSNTTKNPSLLEDIGSATGSIKNMFGGGVGGGSAAAGLGQAMAGGGSALLGLLGAL